MKRADELTLKLLDQELSENELNELAELSKGALGQESFLQLMELEAYLQSSCRSSIEDRVLDQVQQERCDRVEERVMKAVTNSAPIVHGRVEPDEKTTSSRVASGVLGVLAIAVCLVVALVTVEHSATRDDAIAELHSHSSSVRILNSDGQARLINTKIQPVTLRLDETVETSQAIETAEIVYADGTRVELLGEARVTLSETRGGSKQIAILSGVVQADVAQQPTERPLQIVTETATLEVLGTTLGVEVRDNLTQLGVATGRVAMTRKADGQRVEVEAGRFARATESTNEPLQSHPFPKLPSGWSEDFEDGLPSGWRSGEFVVLNSESAVQAAKSKWTRDPRYVITSQNAWQEGQHGFCTIDKNSVLHLRIRQKEFARMTIMIGTRCYPPATGRVGGNLFYTKRAWNEELPSDTWKTISVPLRDVSWEISQGKRVRGPTDLDGLAAYLIHITTMDQDAGLMIDRMWITNESEGHQL